MARASKFSGVGILIVIAVAALAIGYVWMRRHAHAPAPSAAPESESPSSAFVAISADKIDPANDGRAVSVKGELKVVSGAHDKQLGVDAANAVALLRYADMLQWQERCDANGGNCTYTMVWSPQLLSSRKFHVQEGHANPDKLPLPIARFMAGDVRLGAFRIDPAPLADPRARVPPIKPVPYPVTPAQLPTNLALSFREHNGMLYAGDPDHRAVGDVRVIFRTVPAAKVEIEGIQRGDTIAVKSVRALP